MTLKSVLLIADNDPADLATRVERFEDEGYQVIQASTLDQTRQRLISGGIDLALIDLRMEDDHDERDLSGLDLARSCSPEVPKIILTGHPTWQIVREALRQLPSELGSVKDFIDKQEGFYKQLRAVQQALETRSSTARPTGEQPEDDLRERYKYYEAVRLKATLISWLRIGMVISGLLLIILGMIAPLFLSKQMDVFLASLGIAITGFSSNFKEWEEKQDKRMDACYKELRNQEKHPAAAQRKVEK